MALTKVTGSVIKDNVSLSGNVSVGGTLTYQDVTNVDALGIGTFRAGINVSGGQLDVGSNIKIGTAGVVTATTFIGNLTGNPTGSGANLTNLPAANLTGTLPAISGANLTSLPSQLTLSNNADNRVITGGSGVNLNGESTLTYNGSGTLEISDSGSSYTLRGAGVVKHGIDASSSDNDLVIQNNKTAQNVTSNIIFKGSGSGGASVSEKLRITSSGDVGIGITNPTKTGIQNLVKVLQIDGGDGAELILGNSVSSNVSTNHIGAIAFKNIDTSTGNAPHYAGIRCNTTDTSGNMNLKFYTGSTNFESDTPQVSINSNGYVTKPSQPSFTARSTGTWSHGSSTGYLDIDINMVEEFDIGGNYNGQIFTAPVAGKYFFSYTFQYKCTSGYLVVSLRKGVSGSYSSYGRMHVYPPQQSTTYHGPGIIGIIDLAAGNTVKPVAEVNYAGNQVANVNFSGYLLG